MYLISDYNNKNNKMEKKENNPPNILVTTADEELNDKIVKKLIKTGYNAEGFFNGNDTIIQIEKKTDILLIIDQKLPDITAVNFIKKISNKKYTIPTIILTNNDNDKLPVKLLKLGVKDYLIKDSSLLNQLQNTVQRVFEEFTSAKRLTIIKELIDEKENKYKNLFEKASVGLFTCQINNGKILSMNDLCCKMFGFTTQDEILGREKIIGRYVDAEIKKKIIDLVINNNVISATEFKFQRKNGSSFWGLVQAKKFSDQGTIKGSIIDISKRKEAEIKVYDLTFYDQLTKLPNREMFKERIQTEILKAKKRRLGNIFSVMCLGVNRFKNINKIYDANVGDSLLIKIAKKLKEHVYEKDIVSRLNEDKFLILFSDIATRDDVGELVKKTNQIFSEPFLINDNNINITTSIGLCLYPKDGDTPDLLIENSEAAMYIAKKEGVNSHFFDSELNTQMINRFQLENELQEAINNNDFIVYYQPKVDKDGKIIGMESLVRWKSETRGFVPPFQFIHIAETNGMIIDIGDFVLQQSCVQNKKWQDTGHDLLRVSVNISPYQFNQPNLVNNIETVLNNTGLKPNWLELEITESGIIEKEEESLKKINQIHDMGISISIDDFGIGYSSLSKLKDYPIDTLKIDKSFIDNILYDKKSSTIVTTIIDLAHNLNFKVVAEGIETKEQLDFLVDNKCDHFQGYFFSTPLHPTKFEKKIKM